ncbi:MAG: polysaccharide deacetylase family protein [Bacteroidia bacterium]|nr:polysaccharide deacetylase family protein [Bacteroidia bacterium]
MLGGWTPKRSPSLSFYLTIDDGPSGYTTAALLEILRAYDMRATFFWVWSRFRAEKTPHLLQSLLHEGHTLGLHGLAHLRPWRMFPWQVRQSLRYAHLFWQEVGAPPLLYYRPPYGQHYPRTLPKGLRIVWWDLMPPDFRRGGTWSRELLRRLRPGDIVVLHERRENIPEWKAFFSAAYERGWKALPLPQEAVVLHSEPHPPLTEESHP